jgi:hypothetical protein
MYFKKKKKNTIKHFAKLQFDFYNLSLAFKI